MSVEIYGHKQGWETRSHTKIMQQQCNELTDHMNYDVNITLDLFTNHCSRLNLRIEATLI